VAGLAYLCGKRTRSRPASKVRGSRSTEQARTHSDGASGEHAQHRLGCIVARPAWPGCITVASENAAQVSPHDSRRASGASKPNLTTSNECAVRVSPRGGKRDSGLRGGKRDSGVVPR